MAKNKSAPIEKKDTSFGLCPIYDPSILSRTGLTLIDNFADPKSGGKPSGKGLPGGGRKYFEGLEESFRREWEDEIGLRANFVSELYELKEHIFIIMDGTGAVVNEDGYPEGRLVRRIPFDNSRRVEPRCNSKTEVVLENIIHLFKVRLEWEGSKLQYFLRARREKLLSQGVSPAELDSTGVFAPLDSDEARSLGIEEGIEYPIGSPEYPAGRKSEIAGIGLVPATMFSPAILKDPPKGYYYNHLRRIIAALPLL